MVVPLNKHQLFTLSFTDDQVAIAPNAYDFECINRRSSCEFLKDNSEALMSDDTIVTQVEEFKYFGVIIGKNGVLK